MDNLIEKCSPFLRQYWLPLVLGVAGLVFLGYGLVGYVGQKGEKGEILYEAASTVNNSVDSVLGDGEDGPSTGSGLSASNDEKDALRKVITIDVEGAVEKPGVYKLSAGSRMQDGVIAAGGLGRDADREGVAKNINLASKLSDGAKVYIPFEGELESQGVAVLGDVSKLININTAGKGELDSLTGVGEVTAEKIISNRPYGSIEELKEKKVVGEKVFEEIKEKITTN